MPQVHQIRFKCAKAEHKYTDNHYVPRCNTQNSITATTSSSNEPVYIVIPLAVQKQQQEGHFPRTSSCQDCISSNGNNKLGHYMCAVRPQIPLQERILGNRKRELFYKRKTLDLFGNLYEELVNNENLRSMFKGAKGSFFVNAEKGLDIRGCLRSAFVYGTYKMIPSKATASATAPCSSSNQLKSTWTDPGLPHSIANLRNLYIQLERARANCGNDDTDAADKLEGFSVRACKLAKEYTVCYRGKSIQPRFKANTVDFLYLTLEEAKVKFDIAFNLLTNEKSKWFFVVVGSGNHSKDGESVLASGILKHAESKGVKFFYYPCHSVIGFYISGLGNNEQTNTNSKSYFDRAFGDFTEKGASSMNVFVGSGLSKEDVLVWAENKVVE